MSQPSSFGWILVSLGLVMVLFGLVWVFLPAIPWLGRLPGDMRIERPNFRFYFPIVTCLVVSIVLSLVLWIVRSLGGRP
jgi:hypothetical protein